MDNLSKKDRSKCMSHIRSKNTNIEKAIFSRLDDRNIKYKKHYKIYGKPDVAFPDLKIAVFLDSDFWHGWNFPRWRNKIPKNYWRGKIEYNRKRDRNNFVKLRRRGWKVLRFWSHQIESRPDECVNIILDNVKKIKKMNKNKINTISLFCGCGGMDLGVEGGFSFLGNWYSKTGFRVVWANDVDKWACETFKNYFNKNNRNEEKDVEVIQGDIARVKLDSVPKRCGLIIGGFPCQDFSITRGVKRDGVKVKRGKLYKFFVKMIKEKKPKVFIAENVKGILSANKKKAIQLITREFAHINGGYNIYCDLYKFVDYGVPQFRERVLIIGVRSDVNYKYKKPFATVDKHLTAGRALENIQDNSLNHNYMRRKEKTKKLLETIPEGKNVNYLGKDHPLYVKGLMSNIYRKLDRKKPSTTIIAAGGGGTWGYHYEEPRALTNRERARLQTFPDDFKFIGNNSEVRRQIGNAVPPLGIYPVALELRKAFSAKKIKSKNSVEINICGNLKKEKINGKHSS